MLTDSKEAGYNRLSHYGAAVLSGLLLEQLRNPKVETHAQALDIVGERELAGLKFWEQFVGSPFSEDKKRKDLLRSFGYPVP